MAAKHVESQNLALRSVELGFVETVESPVVLTSPFFPSKIGGKPAWLALTGLPSAILCKNCEKPLVFLLQVYVPSEDEKSSSYHRTIFVFCCKNGACYKSNCNKMFVALRCQLTRENEFYNPDSSFQEQDNVFQEFKDREAVVGSNWAKLCNVCGCRGDKLCGKCREVHYCRKEHQAFDWKAGHKVTCRNHGGQSTNHPGSEQKIPNALFPEYELVTEPEEIDIDEKKLEDQESIKKYEEYLKDCRNVDKSSDRDWKSLEEESKKINDVVEDKTYWEFKKIISHEPEQILRYQRHGNPLWVSKSNIPSEGDIPKCFCGAERTFEFQVLPQLLNHLNVDSLEASIDWGTLAVYTCSQNCSNKDTVYHEEFVWKQDFSDTGLPANILSKLQK